MFSGSNIVSQTIPRLVEGEVLAVSDMMKISEEELQQIIVSLAIEKWSHQARSNVQMRGLLPPDRQEELGHILPYTVTPTKEKMNNIKYMMYSFTPDPNDPHTGYLYIDSKTGLAVPISLQEIKKAGDPMCIKYVYGLDASIPGKRCLSS